MDSQNKIKEVVVVEGYHDLALLKAIFSDIDVVITNGSEVSLETLNELKQLNSKRGLILLLDPDYQGARIRQIINDYVGPTKHAFIQKEYCINKNKTKVGIEHAPKEKIIEALENVYSVTKIEQELKVQDIFDLGLAGEKNSKADRKYVTDTLGIGLCNAKTLLTKCNMFGITKKQLIETLGGEAHE